MPPAAEKLEWSPQRKQGETRNILAWAAGSNQKFATNLTKPLHRSSVIDARLAEAGPTASPL
jgi:hypothetical protein